MQCQHLEEKGGGSKRAGVPTEESPGVVLWSEYQQTVEGGVQSSVYHTESTGKMVTPPPIPFPHLVSHQVLNGQITKVLKNVNI